MKSIALNWLINSKLKKQIYKDLSVYTNDKLILLTAILFNIQNSAFICPVIIKSCLCKRIADQFTILYQLNNQDPKLLRTVRKYKDLIVLFIIITGHIFNNRSRNYAKRIITKERIAYTLKLLERLDIKKLQETWEDKFFSYLYPIEYVRYQSLIRKTKKKYLSIKEEIINSIASLLEKNGLKVLIEIRFKTVCSIHKKVVIKNILLSQIMDQIGLRLITDSIKNCYKIMDLITLNYRVLVYKIKDYIALPKSNGYSGIHLTMFFQDHPVEIQIKTNDMDTQSKYGRSAHFKYKQTQLNILP